MKFSSKVLKICVTFLLLVTTIFSQERVVTLPGTIQSVLGGKDWDAAGTVTEMKKVGEDLYSFEAKLPKGNYDYKVAINGTWDENYGANGAKDGVNIPIVITTDNTKIKFTFDYKNKTIVHEIPDIEGFFFMPIISSKVEQKGVNAPLVATNELELGILSKDLVVKSKFNYNFEYDKDSDNKLTKFGDDADIKNLKIAELNADYTVGGFTTGVMVNKANLKNSKDYLGIFDVNTETDKRHGTKNPVNIAANSYGVKFSTDKFAKIDIAAVKYVSDLYETSETQRTFTQMNIEKSFLKDKLTLGTSNLLYQVTLDGKDEDLLINGSLYGKLDLTKNLSIKGELAYIPTGDILESKGLEVKHISGQTWQFLVLPSGYGITDTITEMHLAGNLDPNAASGTGDQWNPANKSYALTKQADGSWLGTFTFPASVVASTTQFKFIYNGTTWDKNIGVGGQSGANFMLVESIPKAKGLENGFNGYYTELNYKLGDKGSVQAGTKFLAADVYLPFAKDELLYNERISGFNRTSGLSEYWFNTDYKITKNTKLELKKLNKSADKNDTKYYDQTTVALENRAIPGTEYVKGYFGYDSVAQDLFKGDYQVATAEAKLNKLPLVKYLTLSTDQRFGSETSKYYAETELKDTLYFINYIKGNLTYAKDDVYYGFQGGDALQYWAEIKFTDIPMIHSFIPYITASYESDDNGDDGIIEREAYYDKDDNNNDWLAKIKLETKLSHESLPKWDGLTFKYESRKIENSKINYTPSDLTKNEQYYVASARTFVEWYSVLTLSTAYTFPLEIKGNLTYKYDLNHENRSDFEDDRLKVELEKKIGKTTINASYNKKDKDNGAEYTKVGFKTVF